MNVNSLKSSRFGLLLFAVLGLWVLAVTPVMAQPVLSPGTTSETGPEIPEELSPELVDALMARLTDAEIRELLRQELVRRAEADAAAETDTIQTLMQIEDRLSVMAERIEERVIRWAEAIANISNRSERISEQLGLATAGVGGMLLAGAAVLLGALLAALAVVRITAPWRAWLSTPKEPSYWDRVLRSVSMGVLELLPIVAFVVVTELAVPLLAGPLGPLANYQWIYETGVSYSWAFIVIIRRAFAPDAPAIRIAPIPDELARRLHRVLRRAVRIGAGGWLIGGLMFHLGLGFPPIMVLRACAGTLVAAVLLRGLWQNHAQIRAATAAVFQGPSINSSLARIAVAAAPVLLAGFIVAAWLYWLAHWLETGQDRLAGPAGTLIVYLILPIFDRMGRELITTLIRSETDLALRMRRVFFGAWRLVLGLGAVLVVAWLWGLDLIDLALGPRAPAWAETAFDILVTVLLGYLIWNLIRAALYTEKRVSDASEDVDPSLLPSASRFDTLVPLFRNTLLAFLAMVIVMIVLSSVGVDIGPLIASAGIVGIAVGFGAQSLVRDVFAGIFFLIDDAFRVGEYIEIDTETRGEVESISVRSMQIRHHRGPVITIPFGELKQIMNHNRDWVIYKMSFRMEPETDPQKFKKLVKGIGKEFMEHPEHGPKFVEPVKSQGVYYVDDDSALVMRVKFKCKPRAQFVLRREIYHRLRQVFAENDMHLARRKVEVVGAGGDAEALEEAASAATEAQKPVPGAA